MDNPHVDDHGTGSAAMGAPRSGTTNARAGGGEDRPRPATGGTALLATGLFTDPAGPLRQGRFSTPLRDERLAALLGAALGLLFSVCFVTGLYSHLQQHPAGWLTLPARPVGLYRLTQGLHVASGIASLPVLVAKLWLVWPRLLSYPPLRRASDAVERLGVFVLVGGGLFLVFSGISNIAQWYPWHFSFTASHYWVAWATIGAIVAHIGAKWATTRLVIGRRPGRPPLTAADPALHTSEEGAHDGLSRRGLLATVAGAAGTLTLVTIGQTVRPLAPLALLAPRDPRDRPVNRSAVNAGVTEAAQAPSFALVVEGDVARPLRLSLADLAAFPRHSASLPIACVEGWSYSATWSGIRLVDLLAEAGAPPDAEVTVESLEAASPYRTSLVNHRQARDRDTLLATHLDGEPLSLDHGYPLRLIAGNRPGVNQTKWVTRLVVR